MQKSYRYKQKMLKDLKSDFSGRTLKEEVREYNNFKYSEVKNVFLASFFNFKNLLISYIIYKVKR